MTTSHTLPRAAHFAGLRRIVVKLGSNLLKSGGTSLKEEIASQVSQLAAQGITVVIVSSGAISAGVERLGLPVRPADLPSLQATAAVGQGQVLKEWERAFASQDKVVAQVLLTHQDVSHRKRFLNARHAINELLRYTVVPIVNENDTVSIEEIQFGDNDLLAALISNLVEANALVLLTDVPGVLDHEQNRVGLATGAYDLKQFIRDGTGENGGPQIGTGGMTGKLRAAEIAGKQGVPTIVADGLHSNVLCEIVAGHDVGTLILPLRRLSSRRHWLAFARTPNGKIHVDQGAHAALVGRQKSLLPSGVRQVTGSFAAGDTVSILDENESEFARGLAAYSSHEIEKLMGKHSADIQRILGYKYLEAVVHRDDLVLLDSSEGEST